MQAPVLCLCTSNASPKCPDLCSFWLCWLAQPQLGERADTAAGEAHTRQSGELLNLPCSLTSVGLCPESFSSAQLLIPMKTMRIKSSGKPLGSYCWGWPVAQSQPCSEGRMSQAGGLHPMPLGRPDPPAPHRQGSQAGQGTLQPPELPGWGSAVGTPTPHGSSSHLSWWCCTLAARPAVPKITQPHPSPNPCWRFSKHSRTTWDFKTQIRS